MMRRMRALGWGVVVAVLLLSGTAQAATQESTSDRLKDRREVTAGTRAYAVGFQDGRFYANGWHITGEMGGVWAPPLKLADGVWFGIDDQWVAPATTFTSGQGYTRYALPAIDGLLLRRTDFVPDGRRGALFGLELANPTTAAKTVTVKVDVHSELLGAYPWTGSKDHPTAADNLQDTAAFRDGALVFTDTGALPNAEAHDYTALVASTRTPEGADLGPGFRGPQPGTVCKDGDTVAPSACDDGPHGKGTGGQLRYKVTVPAKGREAVWIAVAGSDAGMTAAKRELTMALRDPDAQLATKIAARERLAAHSVVDLPGDRTLQDAVEWGKQNLADLTQSASKLKIRFVDQGKAYPAPVTEIKRATFIGAGYPDYPWLFATDGEYTAFPAVALGQFETIRAHLIALRDVSDALNAKSGKVAHEIVTDGSVYFGANTDAGQHRRVGEVRLGGRARLALDGRQPLPRRPLRLLRAHPAVRDGEARRRQGRLAGGPRQRRARGHGPREARQRRLPDPRPLRPRRHGQGQEGQQHAEVGRRPGGQAAHPLRHDVVERRLDPVRGLAHQPRQRAGPAAALDRRHADGGRADDRRAADAGPRPRRARASPRSASARATASPAPARSTSGSSTPAARAARRAWARRRSTRSRPRSRPSARATTGASARTSSAATRPPTPRRCSRSRPPAASPTSSPARCRRSCRHRTSATPPTTTRTSTAAGPAARCSCRPGATTARPGR